ncbi:hypothetical protein BJ138DRAFT_1106491 [Hygrophoropsis aurantiaca]|uniref:Uncharacterized protein n=1 Tax=Hygrophoropsis aurantiaca TaxID=72124 RepID=A0ACB7ZUJ0_9AGAM|nr:hypothetical protein BJ138DRAFT_1106491 [Hygrophoropsis aurantiaca]
MLPTELRSIVVLSCTTLILFSTQSLQLVATSNSKPAISTYFGDVSLHIKTSNTDKHWFGFSLLKDQVQTLYYSYSRMTRAGIIVRNAYRSIDGTQTFIVNSVDSQILTFELIMCVVVFACQLLAHQHSTRTAGLLHGTVIFDIIFIVHVILNVRHCH